MRSKTCGSSEIAFAAALQFAPVDVEREILKVILHGDA
jgi:hypothetical protein